MSHGTDNKEVEEVLGLFFHLLDLSRDVERNKIDGLFKEPEATIHYVFDATLLEVFINPEDPRGGLTSLHAPTWTGSSTLSDRQYLAAQTALSTTEFLVSGGLPAQRRRQIFMTEWHRWEFKRRVDSLQVEQIKRLKAATADQVLYRLQPVKEDLGRFDANPVGIERRLSDRILGGDIRDLKQWDAKQEEVRSYLATRRSIDVLAHDQIVEPSEQVRRLVTPPLRNRFSTLHLAFPPTAEEIEAIGGDSRAWMKLLRQECARHDVEIVRGTAETRDADEVEDGPVRRRSEGALWDDARSLALVRSIARKKALKTRNELVVFVTADQILFDTYRRWYANLPTSDPAYSEPFFMRRISQYIPVLNLTASGKVEGQRFLDLFQDLLQVLEVMLLPLNLSRSTSRAAEAVVSRMRELTSLRPTDKRDIITDPAYIPLVAALRQIGAAHYKRELLKIIERWRALERAALGQADEQLDRRVKAAEKAFEGLEPHVAKAAFEAFVSDLVRTLLSGSKSLSLPLAREFIDRWTPGLGEKVTRAPIALQLVVTTTEGPIAIGELLDDRVSGRVIGPLLQEEGWDALYEQPELVFAIAAAQCMASGDWSNAQHFSEMAMLSEEEAAGPRMIGARGNQTAEIRYLGALVLRFRMGEVSPPLTAEAYGRVERTYRRAVALLDECVALHRHNANGQQSLRLIRALSERAALRLFFSSALNPNVRHAAHNRRRGGRDARRSGSEAPDLPDFGSPAEALDALESAEHDLAECMKIDGALVVENDDRRADFRLKLKRQYSTNIASAAVLRILWSKRYEGAEPTISPTSPEAFEIVRSAYVRFGETAHDLMRLDILCFLTLAGDLRASSLLEEVVALPVESSVLSLDVAVIDAIIERRPQIKRAALLPATNDGGSGS